MIPKSETRFSEKIMRKQMARAEDYSKKCHPALKAWRQIRETSMTARTRMLIQTALAGAMTIAILQVAIAGAQAADYDVGSIHVTQPWARATPKGASAGAAYMTVTNNSAAPDRLSCAGSDAGAQWQITTMRQ